MTDLPKFVHIREEGLREGFQIEPEIYPIEKRAALVEALAETGLKHIQVASLVNPKRVPQMADTPELFARIKRRPDVAYTVLWLNKKGFLRALDIPEADIEGGLFLSASDAFCRQNNGCSADDLQEQQREMLDLYLEHDVPLKDIGIATAFGCYMEGDMPIARIDSLVRFAKELCDSRGVAPETLFLADTVGFGNPEDVRRRVGAVREIWPEVAVGLHLHDTRGVGPANFLAGLEMGVDRFDASLAGLGGCPFAGHKGAAGNVCTEDMVFMCQEMGIETGIDLDALIDCARMAEELLDRPLTGKIMHSGSLGAYRGKAAE